MQVALSENKYTEEPTQDTPRANIYKEYHRRKNALKLRHPMGTVEFLKEDQRLQRELGV